MSGHALAHAPGNFAVGYTASNHAHACADIDNMTEQHETEKAAARNHRNDVNAYTWPCVCCTGTVCATSMAAMPPSVGSKRILLLVALLPFGCFLWPTTRLGRLAREAGLRSAHNESTLGCCLTRQQIQCQNDS